MVPLLIAAVVLLIVAFLVSGYARWRAKRVIAGTLNPTFWNSPQFLSLVVIYATCAAFLYASFSTRGLWRETTAILELNNAAAKFYGTVSPQARIAVASPDDLFRSIMAGKYLTPDSHAATFYAAHRERFILDHGLFMTAAVRAELAELETKTRQ